MHIVTYFAGWQACTSAEIAAQNRNALIAKITIGLLVLTGIFLLRKLFISRYRRSVKAGLAMLIVLLTIVICVTVGLYFAFAGPWCR